jgi:thiosulfate reductase/polysulfide reductase chain A
MIQDKRSIDFTQTLSEIKGAKAIRSFCFICPWTCPMEVFVKGDQIIYAKGNPIAPDHWTRCGKGLASIQLVEDPDRLTHPMKRVGKRGEGKFERISWDTAFQLIADKLQKVKTNYGPEAVAMIWHHDPNAVFAHHLLRELYGTPNLYGHSAGCDQDRRFAGLTLFGHFFPVMDFESSRYIILWGSNIFEAYESLWMVNSLITALENGAKLVVIDPNYTQSAEKAHEWIPIKPGTDAALALAMARVIMDEKLYDKDFLENWVFGCEGFHDHLKDKGYSPGWAESITGISEETITRLARELATTKPSLVEAYKGPGYYTNGPDAMRAIYALNVLTAQIDGPGNICLKEWAPIAPPVRIPAEKVTEIKAEPLHVAMGYPLAPDLPTGLLPKAVIDGKPYPIKVLFTYWINPVMSDMNTALVKKMFRELEFSVCIDIFLSETALECDLVLPHTTFYEHAEIRQGLWKGPQVLCGQPVVSPVGESKPLYDIMKGLADKMGFGEYFSYDKWEEWAQNAIEDLPISLQELKEQGFWCGDVQYRKHEEMGFPTPSGQIELYSQDFESFGYNPYPEFREKRIIPDADYPFQLSGGKLAVHCNVHTQNNPYLLEITPENWVEINPQDAAQLDIKDADYVEISSPLASTTILAKVTQRVQPGVVTVRHGHGFGRWGGGRLALGRGAHINPLVDSQVSPISGANAYFECKVAIRKV